jgi:hypothetical protein
MRTFIALATLLAAVTAAQAQTRTDQMPSPDRSQMQPAPGAPEGRGGAVGTTGEATSGAAAVRRQAVPPNTNVAPGTSGRENQVPQMDRN